MNTSHSPEAQCVSNSYSEALGCSCGEPHSPRNLAESISIEAAELLEIFQWGEEPGSEKQECIREELADVMIYCMSMANALDVDISEIVGAKLNINAEKYPVKQSRGNAKKYSDLL